MTNNDTFFKNKDVRSGEISSYSINLMWLNRTNNNKQMYILPCEHEEELVTKLLTPALKWSKANPEGKVFLWYDSVHTSLEAVKNTAHILSKLLAEYNIHNLQLRDIRDIPMVAKNPDIFSDQIALYFRVDLLKFIIVVDSIEREGNDSAIFADLEVGDMRPNKDRMNKEELFSPTIMNMLMHKGLCLNKDILGKNENQFIQLVNNMIMIDAIKHIVINTNFARILTALNDYEKIGCGKKELLANLNEMVFKKMHDDLFRYYRSIVEDKPILVVEFCTEDKIEEYVPEKHGYEPFGLIADRSAADTLSLSETKIKYTLNSGPLVRNVDVRGGRGHGRDDIKELISRPPTSGDSYACTFYDLSEQKRGIRPNS